MCYSLWDQRKEKLTARIIFASLRLSKSEPTSTSLYRVFRRTLLLLNLFPSMFPSSKAWWSCVQAAQTISMFSSVGAKTVKQNLLTEVKFLSVSNTDCTQNPIITSLNIFKFLNYVVFFPFSFPSIWFLFFLFCCSISYHVDFFTNQLAYLEHTVFQRVYWGGELPISLALLYSCCPPPTRALLRALEASALHLHLHPSVTQFQGPRMFSLPSSLLILVLQGPVYVLAPPEKVYNATFNKYYYFSHIYVCCSFCMLVRLCSKSFKLGFSSMWTENFQMYKMGLEKTEEPEIKLPKFVGSQRKQGNSTSASLTTLKPLTVWKIIKEMGISDHLTCLLRNL